MELPRDLQRAIEREVRPLDRNLLQRIATDLSQRYREQHGQPQGRFVRGAHEVLAYAALRMPATFAAISAALAQAAAALPAWQPATLLDVGSGPGTAIWAAAQHWPSLQRVTALERDRHMQALAQRLAATGLPPTTWQTVDLAGGIPVAPADLVTVAYVLDELAEDSRVEVVRRLWQTTAGLLLIVEPGTPRGFAIVRAARDQLVAAGAYVAAPCPHAGACPIAGNDWCHFAQRITRPSFQRAVKAGELGYEDEKFAFVAASRVPVQSPAARIIRHPQHAAGRIGLHLCMPDGLAQRTVTRSERSAFARARDAAWGDPWAEG